MKLDDFARLLKAPDADGVDAVTAMRQDIAASSLLIEIHAALNRARFPDKQ